MIERMKLALSKKPILRAVTARFALLIIGLIMQVIPVQDINAIGLGPITAAILSFGVFTTDFLKYSAAIICIFLAQGVSLAVAIAWHIVFNNEAPETTIMAVIFVLIAGLSYGLEVYFPAKRKKKAP